MHNAVIDTLHTKTYYYKEPLKYITHYYFFKSDNGSISFFCEFTLHFFRSVILR